MSVLDRFKPAASRKTRLFLGAAIWTVVGLGLAAVGTWWTLRAGRSWASAAWVAALLVGWAKGRFVLTRHARRNVRRIRESSDDRCIGGVYTWPTWIFVLFMMSAGAIIRRTSFPKIWLGLIYTAAGAALVFASVRAWQEYHQFVSSG